MNLAISIKRIGVAILVLSCMSQLDAATIVVTNNSDAGAGSLRDAIGIAVGGDIIDMTGLTGTITLTTGEINITAGQDIFIVGPGYNNLTIDCNNNSRAFNIYDADVAIDSLSIINGTVNDNEGGGAIRAVFGSSLTVSYCVIKDCQATQSLNTKGGAIDVVTYDPATWIENGPVTVLFENSQIENSKSYIGGGARLIGYTQPFTVDINNCTFKNNATGPFGALSSGNDGGALEIVANQNSNASVTAVSIVNSTFSGNNTQGPWNASSGAALSLGTGLYDIHSCTFSNNNSIKSGGAIEFWGMDGSCTLTNTIVAQNVAATTGNDISGTILSGGYNLIGDVNGATFTPTTGDITGITAAPINALLFPLAANGGLGETFAIDCSSPAIDVGGGSPPPLDQIGNAVVCTRDIGAFEYQISCCISDTVLICQGDSLFTDGNWENTAGIYGDTTIQIFNPTITAVVATLCLTNSPVLLSGTPFGGIWSGTGITGNSFDPATAGIGTHLITYTADSIMGSPAVTVTCIDTLSITIITNPIPGTNGMANLCSNGTTVNLFDSLGGSPSTGGVWSPALTSGTGVFDPAIDAVGTYVYTITDCAGNPQTADVVVTITQAPNTGTNGTITFCPGDPATDLFNQLGGSPQTGGTWSPAMSSGTGMFDQAVDAAGTYTYSVTNVCGTSSNDVVVTISANPSPGINSVATLCSNGTAINLFDSLGGTPSVGGTWSPALVSGTGVFDPAVDLTNTYTYTINTCSGNPLTADVVVTVIQAPNTGTNGTITLCLTDPATDLFNQLGGSPQTGGTWSPAMNSGTGLFDPTIDNAGTYTYSITNNCGTSSNNIAVTVNPCTPPVSLFTLSDDTICEGDCISLIDQSTDATSWLWNINGGSPISSTDQNPTNICFNTPGTFSIEQKTTSTHGTDVTTLTVVVLPTPLFLITPNVTIDLGESAPLSVTGATGNYSWSPLTWLSCSICNDPVSTPKRTITYTVNLTDNYGCSANNHVTIFVDTKISIYIPNAFTPNGDGLNDEFLAKMDVDFKDDFELLIFNRWGNLVFESNNVLHGWDGTYQGVKVPSGVFVYSISYHDKGQSSIIKKNGMLNLLR